MRASNYEISAACASLRLKFDGYNVTLPYRVIRNRLEVRTTAGSYAFRQFLLMLNGSLGFKVKGGRDYFLVTAEPVTCFALWRALAIVPYGGQLMDVRMHSKAIEEREPTYGRVLKKLEPLKIVTRSGVVLKNEPAVTKSEIIVNIEGRKQESKKKHFTSKQRRAARLARSKAAHGTADEESPKL
jgi:hypothetical protein